MIDNPPSYQVDQTKKCPLCAEEIEAGAKTCRFCGAQFEVAVRGYCAHCHKVAEVDEAGQCRECGSEVLDRHVESALVSELPARPAPPPIQPAPPAPGAPTAQAKELAIWERRGEGLNFRGGAFIADLIIVAVISTAIVAVAIAFLEGNAGIPQTYEDILNSGLILSFPVVWFLYFTILEGTFGATLGKAGSLRVVRTDGSRCGYGRAAIRVLVGMIECNFWLLGALFIWFTPKHQRLGDLLAGTVVVSSRKLSKVTVSNDNAVLELLDGRIAEIAQIIRGTAIRLSKLLFVEGVTRQGKRFRWTLPFPNAQVMDEVRVELENAYRVKFVEVSAARQLITVFAVLGLVVLLIIGGVMLITGRIDWPSPKLPFVATPTAAPVKLADLSPELVGQRVIVEGQLDIPFVYNCYSRSDGWTCDLKLVGLDGESFHLWVPKDMILDDDQGDKVRGTDGALIADREQIRVTGEVRNCAEGDCVGIYAKAIRLIERPAATAAATAAPTRKVAPTQKAVATTAPTEAVATQEAATEMPVTGAGQAAGRILWNDQPLAGVTVKLCSDWSMFGGCKGTEYETVSGDDGRYTFDNIPAGEYSFITRMPGQQNETMWIGGGVEVKDGETYTVRDADVIKYDLKLTSPGNNTTLTTNTPTLEWETYPGAAYYKVYVASRKTHDAVVPFERSTTNSYAIQKPLEPSEYYWSIHAYNANGTKIAESKGSFDFTVQP